MTSTMAASTVGNRFPFRRIIIAGIAAIIGSAAANALVYFVAAALGALPSSYIIPSAGQPLSLPPVLLLSAVGAVGGTVVFALITRMFRRPVRLFNIIALVVLVLSFATLWGAPGAPPAMLFTLGLMHVVAAAATMGALTMLAPARNA